MIRKTRVIVGYIRLAGERVIARPLPEGILPDPGDALFAKVAFSGMAEALVTGNIKHFSALNNLGVIVLSPAQLLKKIT